MQGLCQFLVVPTSIRELPAATRVVCNCKGGRVFVHELPLRLAADVLGRLLVLINQRGQTPSWRGGERKRKRKEEKEEEQSPDDSSPLDALGCKDP